MPQNTAQDDAREARRRRAFSLRIERGYGYQQIADETGVSLATAWNDVQWVMRQTRDRQAEDVAHARSVEAERLEDRERRVRDLLLDWHRRYRDSDPLDSEIRQEASRQIDRLDAALDRIQRRRARLLGLDAPQRSEVDATVTTARVDDLALMTDAQLRAMAEGPDESDCDED